MSAFEDSRRIVWLNQTCESCPSQWDAKTEDGRQVYIRYRNGRLCARIGEAGDDSHFAGVRGEWIYYQEHGGPYHGTMTTEEMQEKLAGLFEFETEQPNA